MGYTIRPSHPSDAAALSDLLRESFYTAFRDVEGATEEFFTTYFKTTLAPDNLRKVLEDDKWTFLVAEDEAEPVERGGKLEGMIQILHPQSQTPEGPSRSPSEDPPEDFSLSRQAHLSRFYLLPSAQGSGLATKLFNAMLEICRDRGYTTMELDVLSTNYRGIRFYEKMGFKKVKEVHNENDGKFKRVDWIMVKDLE
ncbi:uncharacterized protein I303_101635 [Kwoniella dejecticola CBS 10117]|uniref:N-acetyltransferase domain-containing protein n=1 Tax=Kwoniella dejecticola CBS 10117 TaxID=1296121 RepID=A0A1A6AD92_9TREE|nr:uncharacterized protein I303_02229 [Kwoniella dejecticola CBS 10117]OBR88013.1 hypothetical protein I303_02229 [Kwoniella dejecticola CBS 10117]